MPLILVYLGEALSNVIADVTLLLCKLHWLTVCSSVQFGTGGLGSGNLWAHLSPLVFTHLVKSERGARSRSHPQESSIWQEDNLFCCVIQRYV